MEPLYYGHFGTQNFWPLFAVIQRFSSFRGKNVLTRPVGTKIIMEVFSVVSLRLRNSLKCVGGTNYQTCFKPSRDK